MALLIKIHHDTIDGDKQRLSCVYLPPFSNEDDLTVMSLSSLILLHEVPLEMVEDGIRAASQGLLT